MSCSNNVSESVSDEPSRLSNEFGICVVLSTLNILMTSSSLMYKLYELNDCTEEHYRMIRVINRIRTTNIPPNFEYLYLACEVLRLIGVYKNQIESDVNKLKENERLLSTFFHILIHGKANTFHILRPFEPLTPIKRESMSSRKMEKDSYLSTRTTTITPGSSLKQKLNSRIEKVCTNTKEYVRNTLTFHKTNEDEFKRYSRINYDSNLSMMGPQTLVFLINFLYFDNENKKKNDIVAYRLINEKNKIFTRNDHIFYQKIKPFYIPKYHQEILYIPSLSLLYYSVAAHQFKSIRRNNLVEYRNSLSHPHIEELMGEMGEILIEKLHRHFIEQPPPNLLIIDNHKFSILATPNMNLPKYLIVNLISLKLIVQSSIELYRTHRSSVNWSKFQMIIQQSHLIHYVTPPLKMAETLWADDGTVKQIPLFQNIQLFANVELYQLFAFQMLTAQSKYYLSFVTINEEDDNYKKVKESIDEMRRSRREEILQEMTNYYKTFDFSIDKESEELLLNSLSMIAGEIGREETYFNYHASMNGEDRQVKFKMNRVESEGHTLAITRSIRTGKWWLVNNEDAHQIDNLPHFFQSPIVDRIYYNVGAMYWEMSKNYYKYQKLLMKVI
ncbi:hypothetical protein SNEBB_006097 [Seison nebaliae]|nr:hypothetical protein SNEBB_006097 [Seison nebaliae]